MKIAYVGPKELKIDKTSGSRQVFPRFEPIEIEKEYALRLLRFPTVYVKESEIEAAKKAIEEREAKIKAKAEQKAKEKEKELKDASRIVMVSGSEVDLRKYTSAQLNTFIEANDLDVEAKKGNERVTEFCDRIFDAYLSSLAEEQGAE